MRVLMAIAVMIAMLTMTADADPKTDWTARAKAVTWTLKGEPSTLDYVRRVSGYQIVLVHTGKSPPFGDLDFRIEKAGKVLHAWSGHVETPLVVHGDVLYYSLHSPIASGATIVAIDLATGKQKWRTGLQGIGPIDHSKYRNTVKLEVSDVIVVQGAEASGSYVELVDPKTGKTLANDKRK